ncbi:MAG: S16 family serine protease [Nitrospirales bacterium]
MRRSFTRTIWAVVILIAVVFLMPGAGAWASPFPKRIPHLSIPILGTSINQSYRPIGLVTHVEIDLYERDDHGGLQVQFHTRPGRFSPYARQAVLQAILRAFEAAKMDSNRWTVYLTFPDQGQTLYGESLSAMVGLSVVAMAKGDWLLEGRALTGTITDHGTIGPVGGVQLKILAAYEKHFERVLIPSDFDVRDGDYRTPFLMHVSPVDTVDAAYFGLTGHHLVALP